MNLFILNKETYEVEISPEAMLIKVFKKILARDRSISKQKAKAELGYMWFMCDFKSDYMSTMDEDERSLDVVTSLEWLDNNYKPDKAVKDAMAFYREHSKTIVTIALESQRDNIQSLIKSIGKFMISDDSNDVNRATIMSEKLPKLLLSLDALEKMVKGEEEGDQKHRGTQEKAEYEDGEI